MASLARLHLPPRLATLLLLIATKRVLNRNKIKTKTVAAMASQRKRSKYLSVKLVIRMQRIKRYTNIMIF
jgi:hypothetical protein